MSISGVSSGAAVAAATQTPDVPRPTSATGDQPAGFAERIGDALRTVANEQAEAGRMRRDFELGRTDDLAAVMVQQQVSSLGFEMTLQVRNKALGAYRDIMNMPV
ncbi:MAG: flagellar hook-basal body complex protein FliE [Roseicyclus sp.]|jgi:flagellar hook-basal body complex protein FliE|uniref:flagellar hook-basal body complex protein FliE n=1 Tax=Roseicyclus amphidinii TaxID=3034232 RepID=UPI0024E0A4F3|nr:flagellar hook-basal body complex protein FliE [Roseicyclus sp. Amp-Y-6]MCT4682808.1 flagellar hook-basal body complex protein FliE [Roseicyclus sp.]